MKTALQLQAILNSPDFKFLFLGATRALALMRECTKHDLFDEMVQVENMVGFERDFLERELRPENLKLEFRRSMRVL